MRILLIKKVQPVSVLLLLSKVFEKVMYKQLYEYLTII